MVQTACMLEKSVRILNIPTQPKNKNKKLNKNGDPPTKLREENGLGWVFWSEKHMNGRISVKNVYTLEHMIESKTNYSE